MENLKVDKIRLMYQTAHEKQNAAHQLHTTGYYNDAVSRAYYAVFHLVSMTLFLDGKAYSSHGQLIGAFNKEIISTGLIPASVGKAVGRLFSLRQNADYDFFEKVNEQESKEALSDVEHVFKAITDYVTKTYGLSF